MDTSFNIHGKSLPNGTTLLIVEDDQNILSILERTLETEGYLVKSCKNGEEAKDLLYSNKGKSISLIIMDVVLPGINGLELCHELRKNGNQVPILIISGRDSEIDKVLALESGADDYLVKPFGLRELVARCNSHIRRTLFRDTYKLAEVRGPYKHSNICLYPQEYRATIKEIELELSPKEYKLLELFIQSPKKVWSRDKILEKIWGINFTGDRKTVDVHIRWLRKKIEDDPSDPKLIQTVRGFGYRFT
ncbi:response regulator transcription factor [Prochlorococcus sp. MIT 1223]|uniref:response regulator transcription factor n=1 Tax=Prochlorococcus sp. MIT 1223 TaxID=3096217 RepID=UPI002A75C382|nr:response regulator transcription factor [Prochlorococcus sp. MIT 1223]